MVAKDIEDIKLKFEPLRSARVRHAPLRHVLLQVNSPQVCVITFIPNNPIRQMIADLVRETSIYPPVVICAPAYYNNRSRDAMLPESADLTSNRVEDWLHEYTHFPFLNREEDLSFAVSGLHIHGSLIDPGGAYPSKWLLPGEAPALQVDSMVLPRPDAEYDAAVS